MRHHADTKYQDRGTPVVKREIRSCRSCEDSLVALLRMRNIGPDLPLTIGSGSDYFIAPRPASSVDPLPLLDAQSAGGGWQTLCSRSTGLTSVVWLRLVRLFPLRITACSR